ncbi:alpha/beta hydrolase [Pseudoxanthomonas sp. CF385]|uniref:alpha/beta fold hydrolase n=1 Tax=Pseudoxanthomonas sp. CF385 TaxID=1881042 RepID=UPI0015878F48|nr:alpha/beta hydrolase [Pseudoxanthomonas sp. CF385]
MRNRFSILLVAIMAIAAPAKAYSAVEAATHTINVGQDKVAYRKLGTGRPLLMVNRFRGTIDTWDPAFLDELATYHTLYIFDLPGVGYSQGTQPDSMSSGVEVLDGLARALNLRDFDLLGWSWGGLLAQAYVIDRPGRVRRLVLLATNPPGKNEIPLQPEFLERALKPINDLEDEEVLFFEPASSFSRESAAASRARIRQRSGVDERIPSNQAQFDKYFKAAGEFHADVDGRRGELAETSLPILVIAGDHDTSTAGQNWFPMIGKMQNARFVFYSKTGHAPHHQYPGEVGKIITEFLAR